MLSVDEKTKLANRLRRIAGQVSAVKRMIDEDEYCVDILTQIAAANGALDKVGQIILESHIHLCMAYTKRDGNTKERQIKLDELAKILLKYTRIAK